MGNMGEQVIRYSKAFKETYLIINNLAEELYAKIPESFIKMIKENMATDYIITLKDLQQKGQMEETKTILSLIYRDFLCDEEQKEELIEQEKLQIQEEKEKYNNIFENQQKNETEILSDASNSEINEIKSSEEKNEALIVVENEKWYIKILNKIKKFFSIK